MAPSVLHVAILAKAAGVYARRSAFDAKALASKVLTVPHVTPHVTIAAKAAGVYARRFAFDAKALARAVIDKRGGFEHPLLICDSRSRPPLMVGAHIANPTQTLNEIGADYAAAWTLCDGLCGTPLMVGAHIASPTQTSNEFGDGCAAPWTFDF
jgi:hypothetical protein